MWLQLLSLLSNKDSDQFFNKNVVDIPCIFYPQIQKNVSDNISSYQNTIKYIPV